MKPFTTLGPDGAAQALMLLGHWHQQDFDLLRCRHGFRVKRNCKKCHSHQDHAEIASV